MNRPVMHAGEKRGGLAGTVMHRSMYLVLAATTPLVPGLDARSQTESTLEMPVPQSVPTATHGRMSEDLRSSVDKLVVIAGDIPAKEGISGTYDKETPGLVGGMDAGSKIGTITKEVGPVNVNFPIPILTIPGMVFGKLSGAAKREIQEFRDALTDELAKAENQQLTNDGLALDVYRGLRRLPGLDSHLFAPTTPVPEDTDAVLYVKFNDVGIDVQKDEAIITTSAKATLRRLSDGADIYGRVLHYQDRDTLSNWTENDNALWRDYANFARHYLGREITSDVFDGIEIQQELRPMKTDTAAPDKKNKRQFVSKSPSPTLAWELTLAGEKTSGKWSNEIGESAINYDVEIYDNHRLIYAEKQVPGPRHTIEIELDACQTYRWSVRPSYHVGGEIRFGEWMRYSPDAAAEDETATFDGIAGRQASLAPAYTQDFSALKIGCGRRR